jgi:HEAT repeat
MTFCAKMQGLRDPDAHVRWAACQALGQMCTDLGPDLQQAQHAAMLPGLMSVMDDFNAPRVQVGLLALVAQMLMCWVRQLLCSMLAESTTWQQH